VSIKSYSLPLLVLASLVAARATDSESANKKLTAIEMGQMRPGSRISFSHGEIDAWLKDETKQRVPQGARNTRIEMGVNRATGYVDIDFLKLQQAATKTDPGWLMKNLFAGEHPVVVTARFESVNGRARVDVERVEVSGVPIEGRALDFVIAQYVRPTFPDVKVNEWFALNYGVDRIAMAPNLVTVFMKNKR
jgi:hypothetical protein